MAKWTASQWKESEGTAGKWELKTGSFTPDDKGSQGIYTSEDSKFFGISASFDSFSNEGKDLVVQYQANYQKDVEGTSHLYRLVLKPDNTVVVEIDQEEVYKGS